MCWVMELWNYSGRCLLAKFMDDRPVKPKDRKEKPRPAATSLFESVSSLELPSPYEIVLEVDQGERVEIPWDFARHFCDASYRPTIEAIAMRGRKTLGERIRHFRESAGLTQEGLARAADIGRVTLVRLEKGEQTPRFKTLDAIAKALGIPVSELLVEPQWHLQ